ncbi:MAG: DUF6797 domain-containing protein, partial [Verrucomicrobiales bacterium]
MKISCLFSLGWLLLVLSQAVVAQDAAHTAIESPFGEYVEKDFPFFTQVVDAREFSGIEKNLVPRGIVLDLGHGLHACFDPDLLRMALVWRESENGDYLSMTAMASGSYRVPGLKASPGQDHLPLPSGTPLAATGIYPGWSAGVPDFTDPRRRSKDPDEVGLGPIVEAAGRFEGIYAGGEHAVLALTVAGARVLEEIRAVTLGDSPAFVRQFLIGPHARELVLVLDE